MNGLYHFPKAVRHERLEQPMLDAAYIRDNLDAVKANCKNRLAGHADVDRVVTLDDERKRLISETQVLQQRRTKSPSSFPRRRTRPESRS